MTRQRTPALLAILRPVYVLSSCQRGHRRRPTIARAPSPISQHPGRAAPRGPRRADGGRGTDGPSPEGASSASPAGRCESRSVRWAVTEGVVLVRRTVLEQVGGWNERLFLYHEGFDLSWRIWDQGYTGWYAAGIRMHHPLNSPSRHAMFHRLSARNRVWVAYRNLPAPLIPPVPDGVDRRHRAADRTRRRSP
ncbi:hypothetical protein GCM10010442_65350 [Kitasatospora kifunensis]